MHENNNMSANQAAFADEISLRDLYLIFKKGFPWIILTGLLVGVITFVYLGMQPRKYVAESSTIVTPIVGRPTFNVGGENLKVEGGGSIPFNTYKALAKSRQVVEATMTRVPQFEGDIASLERAMGLSVLVGPDKDNQSGPLAVVHRITNKYLRTSASLLNAPQSYNRTLPRLTSNVAPSNAMFPSNATRITVLPACSQLWNYSVSSHQATPAC